MKIFFSWQSDIAANRSIIEPALRGAVSEFNSSETPSSALEYDSATRDTPGAPDIATTVLEKIRNSDFYICDVTPIVQEKDIANSNVMFELGFAMSCLGWERIILLFNVAKGNIESQLPFDIKTHKIIKFSTGEDEKSNISALKQEILRTLTLVNKKNPPKVLLSIEQRELVCKTRDIENLKWVIKGVFCLKIWDNFFDEFPRAHFGNAITSFYLTFCGMYESTYWHFYDSVLNDFFENIFVNMSSLMDKSDPLFILTRSNRIVPKPIWNAEEDEIFRECIGLMNSVQSNYSSLIKYIRDKYLEVDIDALSDEAGRLYIKEQDEFKKNFSLDLEN